MPNFLHLIATHNNKHGITATHSEMKKTARRMERAYNDRSDRDVAAAEFLAREGGTPTPRPVEDFANLLGSELQRWQAVARAAGIAPE